MDLFKLLNVTWKLHLGRKILQLLLCTFDSSSCQSRICLIFEPTSSSALRFKSKCLELVKDTFFNEINLCFYELGPESRWCV